VISRLSDQNSILAQRVALLEERVSPPGNTRTNSPPDAQVGPSA
jgi:hypothetical protein